MRPFGHESSCGYDHCPGERCPQCRWADEIAALEAKYDTECNAANRWQEIAVEAEAERERLRAEGVALRRQLGWYGYRPHLCRVCNGYQKTVTTDPCPTCFGTGLRFAALEEGGGG